MKHLMSNLPLCVVLCLSLSDHAFAGDTSLVGSWTFDSDAPSTVVDSSAYGNNGTLHGATVTPAGFSSGCYSFDGVSNYIDVGNSVSVNPTQAITIAAWVKPIGKGRGGGDYLSVLGRSSLYTLAIREDGTITFYLPGVKNWVTNDQGKSQLFDGAWHHIVAAYDGVSQAIYIDGSFIASTPATGSITASSSVWKIGAPLYFKGSIDEVRLYNRGLTAAEAQALYLSYGQARSPRTYYVSSSTGRDSNDGISAAAPWKTLGMIYKVEAAPYGIIPGDKILLKRGDTWEGQMQFVGMNGTAVFPITVGAYGAASDPKPIIYGDGRNSTWVAVSAYPGVYEANVGIGGNIRRIFENNTMYPHSFSENPYTILPGQWAAKPYGRSDLIWLRTSDGNPPRNTRMFRAATVQLSNSTNIIIENLDMRETFHAVTVYTSDSINLRNNDTLNTLDIGMLFTQQTNNSIMENNKLVTSGHTTLYFAYNSSHNIMRNNIISGSYPVVSGITVPPDGDNCAIGLHTGTANIIERNTIQAQAIDFYYENDTIIRYNRFTSSGAGTWPHGTNLTIYGNIGGILGNAVNTGTQPINIVHNVFVGARGVYAGQGSGPYAGANGPIIFKNNIVYNMSIIHNAPTVDFGTVVESDYNCFYSTHVRGYKYNGVTYPTLSEYQMASGKDLHSVYGDPKLDANYQISGDSPCKDIGANVSSLMGLPYVDGLGVTIPQGVAPDVGAYEYVGPIAPSITTQPLHQSITEPSTATFGVVATGTPTPTYQWHSAPSGSSTFTAISGATSANYTTGVTSVSMSGTRYHCVVTNIAGMVTSMAATLTVVAQSNGSGSGGSSGGGGGGGCGMGGGVGGMILMLGVLLQFLVAPRRTHRKRMQ